MILKASFDDFLGSRVNLNKTRIDRVRSAHRSVRDVLKSDGTLSPDYVGTFLQGSYAYKTATRSPHDDDPYDVDVVLALDLEDEWGGLPTGYSVLNAAYGALDAVPLYAGKVELRERCVRVSYSSDGMAFHLDVLPADAPDGMQEALRIPRDWCWTHPRGYGGWLNDVNATRCGYLKPVAKLVKYWRSLHGLGVNSMVLTTLVADHLPATALSVDDALVLTLEGIAAWAEDESYWLVPAVENPSLDGEDLARAWSLGDWQAFRSAVARAAEAARAARDSKDEGDTVDGWNGAALYDGLFPTTVRGLGAEARATAAAFSSGTLYAPGSGGRPGGAVTPNRGYFGCWRVRPRRPATRPAPLRRRMQTAAMRSRYPSLAVSRAASGLVFRGAAARVGRRGGRTRSK